jgi:hypothetical protein
LRASDEGGHVVPSSHLAAKVISLGTLRHIGFFHSDVNNAGFCTLKGRKNFRHPKHMVFVNLAKHAFFFSSLKFLTGLGDDSQKILSPF